jgi:hypothetical protein
MVRAGVKNAELAERLTESFRAKVPEMIAADELNSIEADAKFEAALDSIKAPKR